MPDKKKLGVRAGFSSAADTQDYKNGGMDLEAMYNRPHQELDQLITYPGEKLRRQVSIPP
jgi:hypothetical protein